MNRFLTALASLLFVAGLICLGQQPRAQISSRGIVGTSIAVPSIASSAGYNTPLIFDGFDYNTVDIQQTKAPGFNWYTTNAPFYPSFFCGGGSCVLPSPSFFSVSNSTLTVTNGINPGGGAEVMSFGYINSSTQVRTLPLIAGINGFYVEGRFKFPLPASGTSLPDFWVQDFNGTISQILSGTGFSRFAEIDVFEGAVSGATQNIHNWTAWNASTSTSSGASLGSVDYTAYHTWGALVTPMALGGGTGSVKWYVDRVQTGSSVTWTSSANYGIVESSNFAIYFAGSIPSQPYLIDYIGVWVP